MACPDRQRAKVFGATAAWATACGVPLPALDWEGEHLRFGTDADPTEVCAGTLPYMDAYTGALKPLLGASDSHFVDFYWLPDGIESFCDLENETVAGCAPGEEIFAELVPFEHELVHAAKAENGHSHDLLEEGVAMYLGDDFDWIRAPGSIEEALTDAADRELSWPHYGTAGHFLSFLYDGTDHDRVTDAILNLKRGDSEDDLFNMLEGISGSQREQLIAQYEQQAACQPIHFRDASLSCGLATPIVCDDDGETQTMEASAELSCDSLDVIGPKLGQVWTHFSFTVAEEDNFAIDVQTIPPTEVPGRVPWASILLEQCGAGCDRIQLEVFGTEVIRLVPGTYRIRVARHLDIDTDVNALSIGIDGFGSDTHRQLCDANRGP